MAIDCSNDTAIIIESSILIAVLLVGWLQQRHTLRPTKTKLPEYNPPPMPMPDTVLSSHRVCIHDHLFDASVVNTHTPCPAPIFPQYEIVTRFTEIDTNGVPVAGGIAFTIRKFAILFLCPIDSTYACYR